MARFASTKPSFISEAKQVSANKRTNQTSAKSKKNTEDSTDVDSHGMYYGDKTARALKVFNIGEEKMPRQIIKAMAIIKKAATITNEELGLLSKDKAVKIIKATDEIIEGKLDAHFPLSLWQSGSGNYSNTNANEVIANRAIELAGGRSARNHIHPTDDINMSQVFNDTFSIAMHVAAAMNIKNNLLPAIKMLRTTLAKKAAEFENVFKIGRTHLMEAFVTTLGREFETYAYQLDEDYKRIESTLGGLSELAVGGEIIGTDIVTIPKDFAAKLTRQITKLTKITFIPTNNKMAALASNDALVFAHSAIKTLAVSLIKIANDIKLMASGPRCGFGELILPESEPIDPLMAGKVNPVLCEVMSMVGVQVMGNDYTITMAGSRGDLELNTFKPIIIHNFLQSIELLTDAMNSLERNCIRGIKVNSGKLLRDMEKTLIKVKDLIPHISYDDAAKIVNAAHQHNLTLRDAAAKLGILSADDVDRFTDAKKYLNKKTTEKSSKNTKKLK
jgi:fumarate hydratase class II